MNGKKIFVVCLGLAVIAVIAVSVFKVSAGTLFFAGAILACPLMHVWMMKDGKHKH
ncbi:DUF2933 domain-containing protein [Candidatus Collierbacteria bacterium]|nr:DUF2933 domain-containing protein [Candidatus Collierbacteria bacterium]